jgi:hypothetical protein
MKKDCRFASFVSINYIVTYTAKNRVDSIHSHSPFQLGVLTSSTTRDDGSLVGQEIEGTIIAWSGITDQSLVQPSGSIRIIIMAMGVQVDKPTEIGVAWATQR